jgi:hypothetical protein
VRTSIAKLYALSIDHSELIIHCSPLFAGNPFMKKLYHLTTGEQDATRMFVQFCALSGCDFLDSLPNMGIVVRVCFFTCAT